MPETQELLRKLQAYCAIRERCTAEVKDKLAKLDADTTQTEDVILALQQESFLDERRYCSAFVRNAVEKRKLGRNRIYEELKNKDIHESLIAEALEKIPGESQKELILEKIITELNKAKQPIDTSFVTRMIRKLSREGFEEEEVIAMMRSLSNIDI
jgi:regulatory protein